jgi:hypothetical protein
MKCIKCGHEMSYGCFPYTPVADTGICAKCFHGQQEEIECWNCGEKCLKVKCYICGETEYYCGKCGCGCEHLHTKEEIESLKGEK